MEGGLEVGGAGSVRGRLTVNVSSFSTTEL